MIGFTSPEQRFPEGGEMLTREPIPSRGDFIAVVGLSETPAPSEALRRAREYVPDLPVAFLAVPGLAVPLVPDLVRSDHAPFWHAGIPAVMITDTGNFRNPNYHQDSDTPETIDFEFATRVSRLALAATLLLAERTMPLARG